MDYVFANGLVYCGGKLVSRDVFVSDGIIVSGGASARVVDCAGLVLLPGFVDVHVHLREPGFLYKETIASGTRAAARGGYTTVCAMPNLDPVPDSLAHLQPELDAIARDACIRVLPYGAITVGRKGERLAAWDELAPFVAGFSDDGSGVQSEEMMRAAMEQARRLGRILAAHCEDARLLRGGYLHDGTYARAHGHAGICSESEWGQIARDLALAKQTKCAYHVCHISTKESVALIRQAKAEGVDVTCETAPHYLLLDEGDLQEDGRFKMNPPLRTASDREALIEALRDGTIDMIATDHAPHSREEKSRGLRDSAMGIVGLETAFALLYSRLVVPGTLTLARLIELLHDAPCRRFGIDGGLDVGQRADLTAFDLNCREVIDPERFASMGRSTPFAGWEVTGRCRMTVCGGQIVWKEALE